MAAVEGAKPGGNRIYMVVALVCKYRRGTSTSGGGHVDIGTPDECTERSFRILVDLKQYVDRERLSSLQRIADSIPGGIVGERCGLPLLPRPLCELKERLRSRSERRPSSC